MKQFASLILILSVAACGGPADTDPAGAGVAAAGDVTFCSCVTDVPTTSARLDACAALMDGKTPEDIAVEAMACRRSVPVPEGGPDLCYCMRAMNEDPTVMAMCEDIIPEDMTPREIGRKMVECSRP